MSWKLDDIELSTYGVGVIKTSGVLDMPRLVDSPNDWLDLDGVDYWQDAADVKYADREITLYCWISTHAGYADFKSKVAAFYAAIYAEGTRELKYNDTAIADVFVEKEIELPRKTAYVSSIQVGMFTLRLMVQGDLNYYPLEIKRYTAETGTYVVSTVLTKNLKVNKTLQGDIYAQCSFESNTKLPIKYFDFIRINSNGVNDDTFHIPFEPAFEKKSTNKYVYNIKFEHQGKWLDDSQLTNDLNETDFEYYANFDEIIDLIIDSHNRKWSGNFQKGTVATTLRKNHKFTAESCLSVLRRLCEEYEMEYEFEYITYSQYYINIKEQVANDKTTTLEYGKGNGLYELTRQDPNMDELCTVLFAFGATRNIPAAYRGGMQRLSFTGNPISQNDDLLTGAGPHEKTVFFDDIYPRRNSTITAYSQVLPDDLTTAEKEVYPDGIYKAADTSITFNLEDYYSNGLTPKIRFNTGDNAGLEFEICRWDNSTKEVFIIPNKNIRGVLFPNATLHPAAGDAYVLVDIDMPAEYVTAAEAELASAAQDYSDEFAYPEFPYRCTTDPAFLAAYPDGYEIGDRIPLLDTDHEIDGMFRISQLEYDVFRKTYDFTLSDIARLTKRQQTENRLKAVERAMQDTKKDTVESMRKEKETTQELKNRLIDPGDDKFAADRIVRNESLDPRMLAYDSGVPQWYIEDALVELNLDGDEDALKINAGKFWISNYKESTLDRYNISKLKAAAEEYDPTRYWIIAETEFALPTKEPYYMYAKLNMETGSTSCDILVQYGHREVKYWVEDGYLCFKMMNITSGEETA